MRFHWFLFALLPALAQQSQPPYKNPALSVEQRVADLLSRMTLEEKVAQTQALWQKKALITDANGNFAPEKAAAVLRHGMGQITRPSEKKGPREMAEFTNAIQRWVMTNTRLGIPVMFHEECLHGHAAPKGTHFPQAIALASTWNPALVEEVFTAVAREVRARGARQALTPVLDLARDPRWGRVEETYGEDPWLTAQIGLACIRGFQGQGPALAKDRIFATLKHFAAHGQPEAGTNAGPASFGERLLREQHLYPFEIAIRVGKAMSVMPSYNEIDGIPSHANRWLLERVLRQEWGFQGFTVSDYEAVAQLATLHKVAADKDEAAIKALQAGVDTELPDIDAYGRLADLVRAGRVSMETLDRAVARILRAKFLAGLFDDPYTDPALAEKVTNSPEHRALALRAALESIILLKNDRNTLPLDPAKLKTLAVIGPNADKVLLGGYSDDPGYFVTVLDGIRRKVGSRVKILHAEGCRITEPGGSWYKDEVRLPDPEEDARRVAQAVETARAADAIVLVLGGNEEVSREAWSPTHLGDMDTIDLVGRQNELAQKIAALGKPVVVVLLGGRPYAIPWIAENIPAILNGWYLGQETGNAVAQVLFGEYNPAGRLPVTIARNVGQLPVYYSQKPSGRRGYLFSSKEPLFPFGWGLSYTRFEYSPPRLSRATIAPAGETEVEVTVRNAGSRDGDEVVQLYIRDDTSSVTRPVKELRGFQRIHLKAGESKTVRFRLTPAELSMLDANLQRVVEPGTFTIMTGPNSRDLQSVTLTVTP
ncbi:MAG: glycoside hydrolase family 3 N-terminal domain-containing protein [Bryobacteraceae bacterium]